MEERLRDWNRDENREYIVADLVGFQVENGEFNPEDGTESEAYPVLLVRLASDRGSSQYQLSFSQGVRLAAALLHSLALMSLDR